MESWEASTEHSAATVPEDDNDSDITDSATNPSITHQTARQNQNHGDNPNSNSQNSTANPNNTTTGAANNFLPLTRSRIRINLDNQEIIDMNNIEEEEGPEEVAKKARFSTYKLKDDEYAAFHKFINDDTQRFQGYIYVRDLILQLWFANVQNEVTLHKCQAALDPKRLSYLSDKEILLLVQRVFQFLERTGRINFGVFLGETKEHPLRERNKRASFMPANLYKPPLKPMVPKKHGRVIILGAGLSGLTAARQLQNFGLEVIVIEARNRVGGRVHTYRKGNFIADLGPSSLNGVTGNPMVVLGRQLKLSVMELKQKIPIYENKVDKNGLAVCHPVDNLLERAVEREYNKIMEGTRVMKNNYKIEKHHGKPFPVGVSVDWVMKLQEKNIKDEQISHLKSIEDLYQQLIQSANKKLDKSRIIKKLHGQLCSIKDSTDLGNHKDKGAIDTFNRRCLARDLDLALKEYKLLVEQEDEINAKISELTKSPPSDTYLSLGDRRLLDWHFAELEYALGCPINKLGIHYEDDEEIFDGSHWMLVNGFNQITEYMKQDLNIMLGTAVKKVTIGKNGCRVLTYQPDHANSLYVELTADAVLCTLPLGVMQDSIIASQQAAADVGKPESSRTLQKGYQPLIISPPLPEWKTQSLKRLGCGNLNKIILCFEKVFWDQDLHLFGVVNHKAVSRGEFFLFWHHGRTPTLTGLISGEAADYMERLSDVEVLDRCLVVLRSIYGNQSVPAPKDYVVTKWRKDPWARGAWSYLQTGANGDDYDGCAEPVILNSDEQSFKESRMSDQTMVVDGRVQRPLMDRIKYTDEFPRLFFAGEHTARYHFASAHGAVITGLREAARIANIYLGCPYDDEPNYIVS